MERMDEDKVSANNFGFGIGRGKFICDSPYTPVRGANHVDSPAFCSTRIPVNAASSPSQGVTLSSLPDTTDSALNNLITRIAQQVGQSLK